MKIISNCPLCKEHALHVLKHTELNMTQCLYCGYATSDKFAGDKIINTEYKNLTDEMKRWSKESDGRIWVPGVLTLPEGMVYPIETNSVMKWGYAEMVDIPKDKQEQYPLSDGSGFYEQKYDIDNVIVYDDFYKCLETLNKKAKEKRMTEMPKEVFKLPKLKKVKD
jgi:Zn ribbon nucleic-acid-binding protein